LRRLTAACLQGASCDRAPPPLPDRPHPTICHSGRPSVTTFAFPGTVGVPVLILLTGVVLLAVTLVILRVRPPWSHGAGGPSRSDSSAGSHPA
jgi:hypothetical protein